MIHLNIANKDNNVFQKFGKFTVREIVHSDNNLVRKLILEVRKEIGAPQEYLKDIELNNIYKTFSDEKSVFMVLMFNQGIIGTVGILPLPTTLKGGCELKKFYVKRSWRGFGLGMELIKAVLVKAREIGFRNCYLETDPSLQRAGNLYKKLEFRPVSLYESMHLPATKYNWYSKSLIKTSQ